MIGADRCPAGVRDGHARAVARRLEQHLDLGALQRRAVGHLPVEQQAARRLPDADAADLDDVRRAIDGERFEHAAARPRLERDQPGVAALVPKAWAAPPPQLDLFGEDAKSVRGRHRHADGDARAIAAARVHRLRRAAGAALRSACALKACS
jgi:hypothetical protein